MMQATDVWSCIKTNHMLLKVVFGNDWHKSFEVERDSKSDLARETANDKSQKVNNIDLNVNRMRLYFWLELICIKNSLICCKNV